jgi:hypothetical protein
MGLGPGIRKKTYSGSRIRVQGTKDIGSRIRIRNTGGKCCIWRWWHLLFLPVVWIRNSAATYSASEYLFTRNYISKQVANIFICSFLFLQWHED